jgi:FkbM family methyltransferase
MSLHLKQRLVKLLADALRPFHFKGKALLLHTLCPKEREQEAVIFGYQIKLNLNDYIQRSIYLGVFEPFESVQIRSYLKPGMTFIDVGANVGYYTLMAASLVGQTGRVFAFEPSPYAFDLLKETINRNNVSNVRTVQAGLNDTSGEVSLFMPDKPGNHTPSMVPNNEGRPLKVPVQRLDECLAQHLVEKVDLMKIDVEGFEPNVIAGAEKYIAQGKIGAILCEFNKHWLKENGLSSEQLYEMLIKLGFKPANEKPNFELGVQNILFIFGSM